MRGQSVALVIAVSACGGDGAREIPLEAYLVETEIAACEASVACGRMPDLETCRAARFHETDPVLASLIAAVAAGRIVYDPLAAGACVDGQRAPCRRSEVGDDDAWRASCERVFVGTVAQGGACAIDPECADLAECIPDPGCTFSCCPGSCGPPRVPFQPVEIGGACSSSVECVDEAYCEAGEPGPGGTCTARITEGGSCTDPSSCAEGLFCVGPSEESETCKRPPGEGQSCAELSLCDRYDNFCDADLTCRRRGRPGDPCVPISESSSCLDYAACVSGICAARPAVAESCAELECLGELDCDETSTCAAPNDPPPCVLPAP